MPERGGEFGGWVMYKTIKGRLLGYFGFEIKELSRPLGGWGAPLRMEQYVGPINLHFGI